MYVLGDCRTGLSYRDPQTQGMMVAVAVLLRRVRQKPSGKKKLPLSSTEHNQHESVLRRDVESPKFPISRINKVVNPK